MIDYHPGKNVYICDCATVRMNSPKREEFVECFSIVFYIFFKCNVNNLQKRLNLSKIDQVCKEYFVKDPRDQIMNFLTFSSVYKSIG